MNNDEEKIEIIDGLDHFLSINDISLETNINNGDDIKYYINLVIFTKEAEKE